MDAHAICVEKTIARFATRPGSFRRAMLETLFVINLFEEKINQKVRGEKDPSDFEKYSTY